MSVLDLAAGTGLSPGYLYRLLRGEQGASWSVACRIADALSVNISELRKGEAWYRKLAQEDLSDR